MTVLVLSAVEIASHVYQTEVFYLLTRIYCFKKQLCLGTIKKAIQNGQFHILDVPSYKYFLYFIVCADWNLADLVYLFLPPTATEKEQRKH